MAKRRPADKIKEVVTPLPVETTAFGSDQAEQHEEIARLAHQFWIERGCPIGSPEADWLRAETEIRSQASQQAREAAAS